jgi:hypothetical protein
VVVRDPAPGVPAEERVVIRLERVWMPDGLRALAYRDEDGNLVIYVSERLSAQAQRAAVMEAVRASRRAGWGKSGLLPAGVVLMLALRMLLGRTVHTIAARPVAWAAAATATAVGASAAAVFITAAPPAHHPPAADRPAAPSQAGPAQPSGRPAPHGRQVHPVAASSVSPQPGRPASSGQPRPAPNSQGGTSPTTAPSPSSSPAPAQPTPTPSPSATPMCVIVLGVSVCVPALSVSLKAGA